MDPYAQFENLVNRLQFCGSRMFIPDPYFNAKKWFLSSRKYDQGCSSRIRILTFYPFRIPDLGVKKSSDPQHWQIVQTFSILCFRFHKIYSPEEALSQILERDDIFIYETPDPQDKNQVSVNLVVQLLWIWIRNVLFRIRSVKSCRGFVPGRMTDCWSFICL